MRTFFCLLLLWLTLLGMPAALRAASPEATSPRPEAEAVEN